MMRRKNRLLTALLTLFTVITMMAAMSIAVQAATRKIPSMTLKKSTTSVQADKKALTVKAGTTSFKVKTGFMKFKATKTKTYSFKFSSLSNSAANMIEIEALKIGKSKKLTSVDFTTLKKKKVDTLSLLNKELAERVSYNKDQSGTAVTGKIKLKKNEVLYLYFKPSYSEWLTAKVVIQ